MRINGIYISGLELPKERGITVIINPDGKVYDKSANLIGTASNVLIVTDVDDIIFAQNWEGIAP